MQFLVIYWTKDSNLLIYAIHSLSQWCKSMIFWCRFGSESGSSVYEGRKPETGNNFTKDSSVLLNAIHSHFYWWISKKPQSILRCNSWTFIGQKTRIFWSMLFTVFLSDANPWYLVSIRIRGTGSADPCLWLMDPDSDPVPSIFIFDLQDANRN